MEHARIKFFGVSISSNTEIEVISQDGTDIFISIYDYKKEPQFICLNKATAVQLVKKLKLEISKIK